jgi:hypothetical protein
MEYQAVVVVMACWILWFLSCCYANVYIQASAWPRSGAAMSHSAGQSEHCERGVFRETGAQRGLGVNSVAAGATSLRQTASWERLKSIICRCYVTADFLLEIISYIFIK